MRTRKEAQIQGDERAKENRSWREKSKLKRICQTGTGKEAKRDKTQAGRGATS